MSFVTARRTLALLVMFPWALVAQEPPGETATGKVNALFREDAPLEFTMTADFKTVFKDRDTTSEARYPATMRYRAPEGDEGEIPVEVGTRGHSRLLRAVCDFPPLRVYLPAKEDRPDLWRGQKSLKLVVNCKPRDREYGQYVLHEYLVYRMYNLFSAMSFKVRLAKATYLQSTSGDTVATTWSFFIEDPDDMAKRNAGVIFEDQGVRFRDVDSLTMQKVGVFQYMVANTDWAPQVLHNIRVVRVDPGTYYPVPFDFDFAGVVNARYARPSQQLGIRRVTQRLYRGACYPPESYTSIFEEFRAKKDQIYEMHRTLEGFDPKRVENALRYLDEFYRVIDDERAAKREFQSVC